MSDKMSEYKIITDKIEVRSLQKDNQPRYIVNGTAIVANKKHIYDFTKQKDGSNKTLNNIFTPHCIQSIKEQSKHKSIFIDTQHELVRDASIKALMKGKLNSEEQEQMDNMLKRKMLPLAKLNDIDIDGDSMNIFTELNPMFREVDADHKNYFDAVWHSLENKFLNGISINFGKFKYLKDKEDNLVIDDAEVLGFSYVDSPAGHEHSISEVAIRALGDGTNKEDELKMDETTQKKLEDDQKKLDEERKKFDDDKAASIKAKEDVEAAQKVKGDEAAKEAEIKKQKEEQDKIKKDLDEKTEALKKADDKIKKSEESLNKAKGVVKQEPNPNTIEKGQESDPKFYEEQLKVITTDHDKYIEKINSGKNPIIDQSLKGFSEMVNLQAKANDLTADLSEENRSYIQTVVPKVLEKSDQDMVIPRIKN